MQAKNQDLDRRDFLKKGPAAAVAAGAAASALSRAHGVVPPDKKITFTDVLPTRVLGRTKVELPILGYGGAALPKKWGNTLSSVKLVRHAYDSSIRYFDTAISYTYEDSQAIMGQGLKDVRDNVFITTKVDFWNTSTPDGRITKVNKGDVARQVEKNVRKMPVE